MLSQTTGVVSQPPLTRGLQATIGAGRALANFSVRKPMGAVGGGILLILVSIAIFAPVISPYPPTELHAKLLFAPPGSELLLGGDFAGRDVMSHLFYGGRISLFVGIVSVGIGITLVLQRRLI